MKKRIFSLVLIMLIAATALTACDISGLFGNKKPENLIYNAENPPHLVFADQNISQDFTNSLYNAIKDSLGVEPSFATSDSAENAAGEIVFGKSQKAVSLEAYRLLDMVPCDDGEIAYLIYSDGSSVAVAYHDEQVNTAMEAAINCFLENYVKSELILAKGVAQNLALSVRDYHEEKDAQYVADAWEALREAAGGDDVADALVAAFQAHYTIYDDGAVTWLASLYDPGVGGFYHSISARDNFGYLPDAESTAKALGFIESSGMLKTVGNDWTKVFPDEIKEQIGTFIYNLQASDGYFYHPQWPKGTIKNSKRGRDLSWSTSILQDLGITPKYSTPSGVSGEDSDDMASSYTYLPGSLSTGSAVIAASKVVMTAVDTDEDLNENGTPDYLESEEAFLEYLYGLNITEKSYDKGNELSSTSSQIRNFGLGKVLIEFLNEQQLVHGNGIWHAETNYYGINGLMKICGIYNSNKVAMPNADLAINAAIAAITSDEQVDGVVDVYNPWVAVQRILENLQSHGGNEGKTQAKEIMQHLREVAPEVISATTEKLLLYKKPDGSYSYRPGSSASTIQGSPAAISGSYEGDVGGANIAISATLTNMFKAMGLGSYKVPIYTYCDFLDFMDVLKTNNPIVKDATKIVVDDPTTYDDDEIGAKPSDVKSTMRGSGTKVSVIEDPRENAEGNVIEFIKRDGDGSGSTLQFNNDNMMLVASKNVFEADFCFTEVLDTGSAAGDIFRIEMEQENTVAYLLSFRYTGGKITLWDAALTSGTQNYFTDLGLSAELGEWFNLRIEYYPGTHETVRTKIYFNGELAGISDNYVGSAKAQGEVGTPREKTNRVQLFAYSTSEFTVLLDNTNCYKTMDTYTYEEPLPNSYNADYENQNEIVYDFEDDTVPSDITASGEVTVDDGELILTGGTSVTVPANLREKNAIANRASLSFDLYYGGNATGEVGYISILDYNGAGSTIMKLYVRAIERNGDIYLTFAGGKDNEVGNEISAVLIPAGEMTSVKIDLYTDTDATLIYVGGKMLASYPEIFTGTTAMRPARAQISVSAGELVIDNLKFERDSFDYEEATKPTTNSVTHDFEGKDGSDIRVNEGTVVTDGNDKALKLESGSERELLNIALNSLSTAMNVYRFEAKIKLVAGEDGASYRFALTDSEENILLILDLVVNGNKIEIREASEAGTYAAPLATADAGAEFTLKLEYFADDKLAAIYKDGACLGVSAILYNSAAYTVAPTALTVTANDLTASMLVDDVKVEGALGSYEKPTVSGGNAEDESELLTFEYSNVISKPKHVTASLNSEGAALKIAEAIVNGKPTKVLEATTVAGGIDKIHIAPTSDAYDYNSTYFAFEADINVKKAAGSTTAYQIRFAEEKGSDNIAFILLVKYSDGKLTIQDASNTSGANSSFTHTVGKLNTWFHIKIEYYTFTDANGAADAKTVVTIDDKVYVTDVHSGATARTKVTSVDINSLKNLNGTLLLDNVSFEKGTKEYTEN